MMTNGRNDMSQVRHRWALSAFVALCHSLGAGGALAQTTTPPPSGNAAGGLDEIVVTAERREERLQDVPISVTAFSQEKLDQQGLKNIDDLARLSPGSRPTRDRTFLLLLQAPIQSVPADQLRACFPPRCRCSPRESGATSLAH